METATVEREEQPQRDLSVDTGIRRHVEAAIAAHRPGGPDVDFAAQNIKEQHDAVRRAREDGKDVRDIKDLKPQDRLRQTIRHSVTQEKNKAANAPAAEKFVKGGHQEFLHNQAPGTWSSDAKSEFDRLPESVRLAVLREQNYNVNSFGPILQKHAEIEKAIAPHRDVIPKHISEPAAINELFNWYRALQSPNKAAAAASLLHQAGISIQDLANAQGQPYQQPQQYQSQPMDTEAAVSRTLEAFAQNHPHFESVRHFMGTMLAANPSGFNGPDGQPSLHLLYQRAMQQYAPQTQAQHEAGIQEKLAKFSSDKPYFQAVRRTMGVLLSAYPTKYGQTGNEDLQKLYDDACRIDGHVKDSKKSKTAVSPSSRSPSAAPVSKAEKGMGIRAAIRSAIQESRGQI